MSKSEPVYVVAPRGQGCQNCGAGEQYAILFKPEDCEEATSYGDQGEAHDMAEACNRAFERGLAAARAAARVEGAEEGGS